MKKTIPLLAALGAAVLLVLRPEEAAAGVRRGLALCGGTVIPSLFPFFAVIALLLQLGLAERLRGLFAPVMGPLFRMRGTCAMPLLAGLLGGYPSGAKTAAQLYSQNRLTRQEAELLLGFCDNCGPGFLLGYAGAAVLGDGRLGGVLCGIHLLSALLTGALLCRLVRTRGTAAALPASGGEEISVPRALTASVQQALGSTLSVCAFVVLFQTLTALLPGHLPWFALGGLELVTGLSALPPGPGSLPAAAALAGWGGLSVHCQALAFTAPEGLSFRFHWLGKGIQAALSAALAAGYLALAG